LGKLVKLTRLIIEHLNLNVVVYFVNVFLVQPSNRECSCGKTKRRKLIAPLNFNRFNSKTNSQGSHMQDVIEVCPTCGVEPTNSKVRRYRMGCISLKKPVAHMWYFRNNPNVLASILNMRSQEIDETVHFQTYTASKPGTQNYCLHGGVQWFVNHWEPMHPYFAGELDFLTDTAAPWNPIKHLCHHKLKQLKIVVLKLYKNF
jgi:hypothetical protein